MQRTGYEVGANDQRRETTSIEDERVYSIFKGHQRWGEWGGFVFESKFRTCTQTWDVASIVIVPGSSTTSMHFSSNTIVSAQHVRFFKDTKRRSACLPC
eukprot:1686099-Amphidinium_carterae.2